jgi:hypothetical protein
MARCFSAPWFHRSVPTSLLLALCLLNLAAGFSDAAPFDHPWTVGRHDQALLAADVARLLELSSFAAQTRLATEAIPVWVYFADKGIASADQYATARADATANLTPAARARRAVLGGPDLVDYLDLAVRADYIRQVAATGVPIRTQSRWLNAVSVDATPADLERLAALPMVSRLAPVARGRRSPPPDETAPLEVSSAAPVHLLSYGPSETQLTEIQVTDTHDLGYSGAGVIVCMLDTGYFTVHEVFDEIRSSARLIAERDFINGDWITQNEPGDPPTQHNHGTYTWSALGGTQPGELYGPAYGATFAIAKTEDVSDEQPIEEDFWVAASEWADSLGANVISSSLAYKDWYTYEDMDGNTAVTTNAADIAASRNILVANSAGNEGTSSWHYILAPADADSILACGAVNSENEVAGFSSRGPTFDGRTKPEVVARGVSTHCATSQTPSSYGDVSGTSLSAPLVGGSVALVMEAHPDWSAMQVREALMMTADTAANPDNDRGWGRLRVLDAINYISVAVEPVAAPALHGRLTVGPNPFSLPGAIQLEVPRAGRVVLDLYGPGGRHVARLADGSRTEGRLQLSWDGRDARGRRVAAGVYLLKATGPGWDARTKLVITR